MGDCNEPEIPSTAPEDSNPTPTAHVDIRAGTLKSSRGSADACAGEDEISAVPPNHSFAHFVLGNFALAMFLISLIIFIVFFAVTWFTVIRDARLMKNQLLSNTTGVSLSFYFYECALLTVVVAIAIDTRP